MYLFFLSAQRRRYNCVCGSLSIRSLCFLRHSFSWTKVPSTFLCVATCTPIDPAFLSPATIVENPISLSHLERFLDYRGILYPYLECTRTVQCLSILQHNSRSCLRLASLFRTYSHNLSGTEHIELFILASTRQSLTLQDLTTCH